jgi:hypothetical protein
VLGACNIEGVLGIAKAHRIIVVAEVASNFKVLQDFGTRELRTMVANTEEVADTGEEPSSLLKVAANT